jgi:hypothetical protein
MDNLAHYHPVKLSIWRNLAPLEMFINLTEEIWRVRVIQSTKGG